MGYVKYIYAQDLKKEKYTINGVISWRWGQRK